MSFFSWIFCDLQYIQIFYFWEDLLNLILNILFCVLPVFLFYHFLFNPFKFFMYSYFNFSLIFSIIILSFLFLSVLRGVLFSSCYFQFCLYFSHLKKNSLSQFQQVYASNSVSYHIFYGLLISALFCVCVFYCFINLLKIHGKVFCHVFCFCTMAIFFWQIPLAIIFPVLFLIFHAIF